MTVISGAATQTMILTAPPRPAPGDLTEDIQRRLRERDELLEGLWELLSWAVIRQDTSHQLLPLLPEGHPLRTAAELISRVESE